MSELSRGELLDCYAEQYFGEHQIFRVLADKIQDNSFFITGATGLFGSWMMAFLHWTVKRKFAEPKVAILTRSKIRCSQCWFDVIGEISRTFNLAEQHLIMLSILRHRCTRHLSRDEGPREI